MVRAILLLVETITGIRSKQFSKTKLILAKGQLGFPGQRKPFFSQSFRDSCQNFFRRVETSFSMISFILASGNGFSGQWKLRGFFSQWKLSHILSNVTDFLASGNQLLPLFQTTVNCCHWKQFLLQLEHIFQSIIHSDQWKRVFCLLETVSCYSKFFSANGNYY